MAEELIKIGDLAKMAGASLRTIRYYEELGLIAPASRSAGGFRYFSRDDLKRVLVIKKLQMLDYPLTEIKEIFSLRHGSPTGREAAPKVLAKLEEQTEVIVRKLEQCKILLGEIEETKRLVKACFGCPQEPNKENCSVCPVLVERSQVPLPFEAIL